MAVPGEGSTGVPHGPNAETRWIWESAAPALSAGTNRETEAVRFRTWSGITLL